ncbi:MAG: hypothetical protein H7Y38_11845 [Armatimonadetes bacterium]|nr:hypothetical protein [Armatimonadota bacterium]
MNRRELVGAGVGLFAGAVTAANAQNAAKTTGVTKIVKSGDKWQLVRDGKPYFVRGVGGTEKLPLLKSLGGNSVRTWGAENIQRDLDAAHAQGLTMTAGIWLGHKTHGFKYDDPKMVREQFDKAQAVIKAHKNHPALLAWGIGNEMEGDGNDPLVWKAIQEIAAMAHKEDPNHPTICVTAEIGGGANKAKALQTLCPDIDILGINSYGGLSSLSDRLKEAGITKPYVVTEFGPNGPWEVGKTRWNAPLEPSSTEKGRMYLGNYLRSVAGDSACVGSYAFLWGDKVEGTPTWFGMLLPTTGERLAATDAISYLWTGKWPAKPAPDILAFQASVAEKEIAPGTKQSVVCVARGAGDLAYEYVVRPEKIEESRPDPGQKALDAVRTLTSKDGSATFTAPTAPGAYRLFVTVRDAANATAATANTPFFVKG